MSAKIAAVLEHAATLIEPPGTWGQGESVNARSGLMCMATAMGTACGHRQRVYDAAYRVVVGLLPKSVLSVVDWNDEPKRTQAEAVAKLREAAAKARGKPS